MRHIASITIIISLALITFSCVNRHFVDGRYELVSTADTALNDSALIYGNVYHVDWHLGSPYPTPYEIWIDDPEQTRVSDTTRHYYMKVNPGYYTIKCQTKGNTWSRLTEELKNLHAVKNKKTRVDFYLGYTIE